MLESVFKILNRVYRVWFTGVLVLLMVPGYILYSLLFLFRVMGKKRIIIAAVIAAAGFLFFGWRYYISPVNRSDEGFRFIVRESQSVSEIAEDLESKEVVRSGDLLLLWLKLRNMDKSVKAGEAKFYQDEGIASAARKLTEMEPVQIRVTVPEGLTIWQTSAKVSEYMDIDTSEFNALCMDTSFIRDLGFADIGSLEGYLLPETYLFPEEASSEKIIRRMCSELEDFFSGLKKDERVEEMSRHEILTLSSIVEAEATLPSERRRIAGVFLNRLERGIPLGADPTVRYALRKFSGPLFVSELENDIPYNTRIRKGLPPGPICSPGKGAIQAVCDPLETDELYFVAKWDGTGTHSFSVTNAEHERKKKEIRRKNHIRKRMLEDEE